MGARHAVPPGPASPFTCPIFAGQPGVFMCTAHARRFGGCSGQRGSDKMALSNGGYWGQ
ncbi:hypothetical protein [Oryza sativa Japonica Group]|uniref:Uncharacterized protein n=1 Tax=Oryza sativa subsp. japonica TaxID=39947 RepID=Q5QM12_ORYSJ|nr:hypothetical protein [Oryza sativa Japonica Group]